MRGSKSCFFNWSYYTVISPLFLLLLSHSFRPSSTHPPPTKPEDFSVEYYNYHCANSPPFHCGNITTDIKYPFRTSNHPYFCGHPDFELICDQDNLLSIHIGGKRYHVMKEISYRYRVLQLLDFDLPLAGPSCPEKISNTSFDFSPFTYPDDNQDTNLTMFLNCHDPLPEGLDPFMDFLFPTQCSNRIFGQYSYFTLQSFGMHDLLANCATTVLLPVSNLNFSLETFRNGSMNFSKALKIGFSLTWTVEQGWCEDECRDTGGICGSNPSDPKANACFCPSGNMSKDTSCAGNHFSFSVSFPSFPELSNTALIKEPYAFRAPAFRLIAFIRLIVCCR